MLRKTIKDKNHAENRPLKRWVVAGFNGVLQSSAVEAPVCVETVPLEMPIGWGEQGGENGRSTATRNLKEKAEDGNVTPHTQRSQIMLAENNLVYQGHAI